jgi:gas vesicle protein
MGFLIGILTGAVVALLYAPKPGDLTRIELRERTEELMRRADELERVARDLAGQAQVKGRELADEAKRQWEGAGKRPGTGEGGPSTRA